MGRWWENKNMLIAINTTANYIVHHVYSAVTGRWFSQGTPVSFTNKTDRHDITEILSKVALKTLTLTHQC
jgi:hypothetical protein